MFNKSIFISILIVLMSVTLSLTACSGGKGSKDETANILSDSSLLPKPAFNHILETFEMFY